jgi:hypothetical protein
MKKLSFLALMLFAIAAVFTNCSTDDSVPGPDITFANGISSTDIDFSVSDPFTVSIVTTVTAEGEIKTLTVVKKDATGSRTPITITGSYSGKATFSETFVLEFASSDNFPFQIVFNVTDKNGKGKEKIYSVTKKTASGFTYTKTGQFYHIEGLLKGAYDLDGDAEVAAAGTASAKSMKNTDAAGVAFTGSWTSDAANGTQFVKSNTYDYANATVASATTAYAAGSASATVTNPAANDIYIAKKNTTYYVIKILTLDPAFNTGTGGNTGKITFEYKKN